MSDSEILLQKDPIETFKEWFGEASKSPGVNEPQAMAIATISSTGELHNRIVLLKQVTDKGLIFFTNYNSSKGNDLNFNPQVEALFFWDSLKKQVRIGGLVEKTSREISEKYWNSRPRDSQLSQYISHQSNPVDSWETLQSKVKEAEEEFEGRPIPCPSHWGGYLIKPDRIELWIGTPNRLHHRFYFKKDESGWTSRRLYP